MEDKKINIPATVSKEAENIYKENYNAITKSTGKLFLFAGDQKIEHLNKDFYGENIPPEVNSPEHLFKIASKGEIGAFATQMGLISQYGKEYPDVNYVVKVNSKTDVIPTEQKDPVSSQLWTVEDVLEFKQNSGLKIRGVGYTVYLGSEFENEMLSEAAHVIYEAQHAGLVTILWMYPRGKHIKDEKDADLLAGAAGVAAALGADFAKLNPTEKLQDLRQAIEAAGKTKIICSGGPKKDAKLFLQTIREQLKMGTSGVAIGRNIYQNTLKQAVNITQAVSDLVYNDN
ncbi:aldolase [Candidatus Dependentiae bacterium]